MPDGRMAGGGVEGDTSVDGFIAGGGLPAPLIARSSTLGGVAIFGAPFDATFTDEGLAATRAVTLLGLVFFTSSGLGLVEPGREVERAMEEERVERAGWAISPRAYHCPRSGVNGRL